MARQRPPMIGPFHLTARETRIARAYCQGDTTAAIAALVGLTTGAVKQELHRIYLRLGIDGTGHNPQASRQMAYLFGVMDAAGEATAQRVLAVMRDRNPELGRDAREVAS